MEKEKTKKKRREKHLILKLNNDQKQFIWTDETNSEHTIRIPFKTR